ncbi:Hypothetical predicted protein [Cloeon dipterum]|uniref:Uncharacterized protein n=2 Tax=Cloeon dipterum TaxID=197152 RepID=A0A8S1E4D0_9INSE|nr:Hypothetical predicted protein [Cloeon dipterum]
MADYTCRCLQFLSHNIHLQNDVFGATLSKMCLDLDLIKSKLAIEEDFDAEKLRRMNVEYERFLEFEQQHIAKYRLPSALPKTYSQIVKGARPAEPMEADGWKKVARRKKRRETAAGQGSDRHDPASKVVKARAGSKRGASAARAPAACTAKASLSGTCSHTPPACSTGRLVSSSPPADTGGAVTPRVHLSSISSPESHVQKEAEPEASHQKDDTGAKNKSPILKTKAQGNRRDRAAKSVKVCAGSQGGASAARGPGACAARVDVHAGARSLTPPASSIGRLVSSPPAAAGGAEIPLAQILPNYSPETHAEPKMSNQKDVCADNDIDWESEAQDDRRDRAVKPVKAIAGSKRGESAARASETCTARVNVSAGARSRTPPASLSGESTRFPPSAVSAGGAVFSDTDEGSVFEVPVKLTAKRMTLREYADYIESEREKEGEEKAGERTATNAENPLINMRPRRKNNRKVRDDESPPKNLTGPDRSRKKN